MLCYHGTTADNLASILENGLSTDRPKIWNVSRNEVYFWGKNYVESELCDIYNEETQDKYRDALISQAFDSALCAVSTAKDCRAVVVIFDIPELEHETDNSCEGMDNANCVDRDIQLNEIKEIIISNDLSLVKGYFIALMRARPMFNSEFTAFENEVADIFQNNYLDISDFVEWSNVMESVAV